MSPLPIEQVNALSREAFIATFGPVFEKSPWVAEAAWAARPFRGTAHLLDAMFSQVQAADETAQLALLRAHPDLAGRLAVLGALTAESTREQRGTGLLDLSADTLAQFQDYNSRYSAKFGFPFIICARLNRVETILAAFEARLGQERALEWATALGEIRKIAELRLRDIVEENGH